MKKQLSNILLESKRIFKKNYKSFKESKFYDFFISKVDNVIIIWMFRIFWYVVLCSFFASSNIVIISVLLKKNITNVVYYIIYPVFVDFFIYFMFSIIF